PPRGGWGPGRHAVEWDESGPAGDTAGAGVLATLAATLGGVAARIPRPNATPVTIMMRNDCVFMILDNSALLGNYPWGGRHRRHAANHPAPGMRPVAGSRR